MFSEKSLFGPLRRKVMPSVQRGPLFLAPTSTTEDTFGRGGFPPAHGNQASHTPTAAYTRELMSGSETSSIPLSVDQIVPAIGWLFLFFSLLNEFLLKVTFTPCHKGKAKTISRSGKRQKKALHRQGRRWVTLNLVNAAACGRLRAEMRMGTGRPPAANFGGALALGVRPALPGT